MKKKLYRIVKGPNGLLIYVQRVRRTKQAIALGMK